MCAIYILQGISESVFEVLCEVECGLKNKGPRTEESAPMHEAFAAYRSEFADTRSCIEFTMADSKCYESP
jgi:hypothetical protein